MGKISVSGMGRKNTLKALYGSIKKIVFVEKNIVAEKNSAAPRSENIIFTPKKNYSPSPYVKWMVPNLPFRFIRHFNVNVLE